MMRPTVPTRSACHRRKARRGVVTLEFLLVFPILVIAALATLQFGIVLLVDQAITSASIQGAREASELGSDPNSVADVVQQFLGVHSINFDTLNSGPGLGDAFVAIEFGDVTIPDRVGDANQTYLRGNTSIPWVPPAIPLLDNQVRVTVCANVTDLAGLHPVPDWLDSFGFSMNGYVFQLQSLAYLE